jgi:hypothetical protein
VRCGVVVAVAVVMVMANDVSKNSGDDGSNLKF